MYRKSNLVSAQHRLIKEFGKTTQRKMRDKHIRGVNKLALAIRETTKASLERQILLERMARFRPMTYAYWINGKKITKHL